MTQRKCENAVIVHAVHATSGVQNLSMIPGGSVPGNVRFKGAKLPAKSKVQNEFIVSNCSSKLVFCHGKNATVRFHCQDNSNCCQI